MKRKTAIIAVLLAFFALLSSCGVHNQDEKGSKNQTTRAQRHPASMADFKSALESALESSGYVELNKLKSKYPDVSSAVADGVVGTFKIEMQSHNTAYGDGSEGLAQGAEAFTRKLEYMRDFTDESFNQIAAIFAICEDEKAASQVFNQLINEIGDLDDADVAEEKSEHYFKKTFTSASGDGLCVVMLENTVLCVGWEKDCPLNKVIDVLGY